MVFIIPIPIQLIGASARHFPRESSQTQELLYTTHLSRRIGISYVSFSSHVTLLYNAINVSSFIYVTLSSVVIPAASLTSLVSIHLFIHLSTHLSHHPRSHHPLPQAQNLPFHQILPTIDFFYLLDCLMIMGLPTYICLIYRDKQHEPPTK